MKVFINRKSVIGPWGGGNKIVIGMFKYSHLYGIELTNSLTEDVKAVFMINPYPDHANNIPIGINEILRHKNTYPNTKLIHRVNDKNIGRIPVDTRFDELYKECSKYCEGTIFVSNWLKDYYFEKGWHCQNNKVIINGVDRDIFKSRNNKISLENKKLNIVTHHWSNNPGKGFDIYDQLEKFCHENSNKYTFTYIGRHRDNFKYCKTVGPLFGSALGEELSKYDLYVSASQYEAGPNHILESLASEIPVLVIDRSGGGIEMVASQKNIFSNSEELIEKIKTNDYSKQITYKPKDMKDFIGEYCNYINEVAGK